MTVAKQAHFCDIADAELIAHPQACPSERDQVEITPYQPSLDDIEAVMLQAEQVDCPVQHHFGGGIYIRDGIIPAGTYVIGHAHKGETMNILQRGKMAVLVGGDVSIIEGPFIFVSPPGRKVLYAIEDCVFQNIHPTDKTDLVEIEEQFIEKSATWQQAQIDKAAASQIDAAVKAYLWGDR